MIQSIIVLSSAQVAISYVTMLHKINTVHEFSFVKPDSIGAGFGMNAYYAGNGGLLT